MYREAFPDLRFEVEDVIATDDTAVARIRIRGTQRDPFMGVPATGNRIDIAGMDWVRIRGGKAVEHWGVTDTASMME